ncbi:MAG: Hsp70 family protein, partial [Spirochaetaceae bacterium]|nr:Hsp70 family protein [Spirochaetaceae bacterium]
MYGIDFGTSNTVVTHRGQGGSARILDLGEGGVIPSLLYFERDRRPSVGAEAIADYGEALRASRGSANLLSRFRFFQALKLALKDEHFEGTRIFGDFWKVETLVSFFLKEVKRRADEALAAAGERPDARLVLGRPVVLADDPAVDRRIQERFEAAARLAGFEEVSFVLEPVAASVSVLDGRGGIVLVFDFGGGTLDISVARQGSDGLAILANAGIDLGGYLLNEDISRARIIRHFGSEGRFRTMTG